MDFKLPFPTLQDIAVLKVAHSLMDFEMPRRTYIDIFLYSNTVSRTSSRSYANKLLHESLSKVDKLEILVHQKFRIREVIMGTHDHLQDFYGAGRLTIDSSSYPALRRTQKKCSLKYNFEPKLQFDVYGRVDEVSMAKHFLQKGYSDDRCDTDLFALLHSLYVASYYVLLPDIQKILPKILKLGAKGSVIPQLEGPEFQIEPQKQLCLVYKFVDQQGIPVSLHVDYFHILHGSSAVRVLNTSVRITLNCVFYNSEIFQVHWNLVEPSKRMRFVRNLIRRMLDDGLVRNLPNIFYFLDPDFRRSIMGEYDYEIDNDLYMRRCFLVWPYQVFFNPSLQLVRSLTELQFEFLDLFEIIVSKLDMMAFQEILCPFWEAISSEFKSKFPHLFLDTRFLDTRFQTLLRELSRKNIPMYKRVANDLNLPLIYLQNLRKRKYEGLAFLTYR